MLQLMARAFAWLGGHTAKLHGDAGWVARSDAGHPRSQGVWEKSPLVGLEQSAKILGHLMGPAIDRKSQKWRRSDRICPSAAFAGTASFRQACQIPNCAQDHRECPEQGAAQRNRGRGSGYVASRHLRQVVAKAYVVMTFLLHPVAAARCVLAVSEVDTQCACRTKSSSCSQIPRATFWMTRTCR